MSRPRLAAESVPGTQTRQTCTHLRRKAAVVQQNQRFNSISCRAVDSTSVPTEYNNGRRPPYLLQTEAFGVADRYNPSSEL